MLVTVSVLGAVAIGFFARGWPAYRTACQGDLRSASKLLWQAGAVSAFAAVILSFLLLGWPWQMLHVPSVADVPTKSMEPSTETTVYYRTILGVRLWEIRRETKTTMTPR